MLQILDCEQCGKSELELNSLIVEVSLIKSDYCESCRKSNEEKQTHFFCFLSCFRKFCCSLVKGDDDINWRV